MEINNREKNIKYNQEVLAGIIKHWGSKEAFLDDYYGAISGHFICVNCGKNLPAPVIIYFKADPARMLCYKCQGRER